MRTNEKAANAFHIYAKEDKHMDVKDITKAVGGDSIAKTVDKVVDTVADKIPAPKAVKDGVKKEVKKVATAANIEKVATKENLEKAKDAAGKVIEKVMDAKKDDKKD